MKQYQEQQQQVLNESKEEKSTGDTLDSLQKQAAYYAQQQRTIQTQLEASLSKTAEQLIQEIANLAAVKTNQPIVLNQYSHQQHHLHQHHYAQMPLQQQQQQQPQSLNPQIQTPLTHPMMMRHIVPTPQQLGPQGGGVIGGPTQLPPVPIMPPMQPNVIQPNLFY
jgi:hypothetical protein